MLSAGAIQSPQILMLSGVGDAGELRAARAWRCRRSCRASARTTTITWPCRCSMETGNTLSYGLSLRTLPRAAFNLLQYAVSRSGPLASNVFESTAFIRSAPGRRPARTCRSCSSRRAATAARFRCRSGTALRSTSWRLYPQSRGRITLASADPRAAAADRSEPAGRAGGPAAAAARAAKLARRLLAAPAFARYRAVEVAPGPACRATPSSSPTCGAPPAPCIIRSSTCRMGQDAAAVVDARAARAGRRQACGWWTRRYFRVSSAATPMPRWSWSRRRPPT